MKYKAKKEYAELPNEKNFLAIGGATTHLKLIAGLTVEINTKRLPMSKVISDCLTEIKSKGDK